MTYGVFLLLFFIVLGVFFLLTIRPSSPKNANVGFIKGQYSNNYLYNVYSYPFSVAANRWLTRISSNNILTVNISEYTDTSSNIVSYTAINKVTSGNLTEIATIYINTYVYNTLTQTLQYTTFEHELGHVFGIGTNVAWTVDSQRLINKTAYEVYDTLTNLTLTSTPVKSDGIHWENDYNENIPSYGLANELMINEIMDNMACTSLTLKFLSYIGWSVNQDANQDSSLIIVNGINKERNIGKTYSCGGIKFCLR
jgi:hypothetical protein